MFPNARVGDTAGSEEPCDESKVNYDQPLASRTCTGDGLSAAEWDDPVMTDCGPDATAEQLLERLVNMNVSMDNVEEVSDDVEEITSKSDEITVEALESTAQVMEDILSTDSNSTKVTDSVVQIVDNLFDVNEEVLMESQMEDQAPTRIVAVLEEQLSKVEIDESGVYEEVTPNVAVQAQRIDTDQISRQNITYFSFISTSSAEGVGNVETIVDEQDIPDAANVSIAIPASISDVVKEKNVTELRLIVIVYNDSLLFQTSQFSNSGRRPNSQVISLSVKQLGRVDLKEPILITFIPIEISETNTNTKCVFWDFELGGIGGWSTEGCTFKNRSADGSDRQYCECTHLTNFAILMDFHMSPPPPAADIVTTVGLSISIVCLCLTVFTFVTKRKFRRSEPKKILCQLCLSLLGLYVAFLVGIDKTGKSKRGCIVAAAVLHYFLLSSIFWMTVQAVNMYYLFVKVFDNHVRHLFLKACFFAWGLPVIIVLVSAFVDINSYANNNNHCFLTIERMYYGVAAPVALSLLINTVVFIMVLHSLGQLGKNTIQSSKIKRKSKGMQMLQNGASITMVLGLTWLIGFFAIGDASTMMLWLFCILNSFQGFLIFLMYCVRNEDVRTHWRRMLLSVPGSTTRFRSFMSSETRRSSLFSSLIKSGKSRSSNRESSYRNQFRQNHSENSEIRLGKRSLNSENVILRQ